MRVPKLYAFLYYEILFILIGLTLIIAFQMLTGRIKIKRVLFDKGTGRLSPGRVQLFILTVICAFLLVLKVVKGQKDSSVKGMVLVLIMSASHALYLGGKLHSLIHKIKAENHK